MNSFAALLMGVAYVLPPGPVTVETIRRSSVGGLRAALAVQLGAVAGDMIYAMLMAAGPGRLLQHPTLQLALGLIGASLLMYLGVATLCDSWRPQPSDGPAAHMRPCSSLHHAGVGLALSLANPYGLAFWLALGGTLGGAPMALGGFFAGSLGASVLTALAAGQLGRPGARRGMRWIWRGCGGLLLLLGLQLGYASLSAL